MGALSCPRGGIGGTRNGGTVTHGVLRVRTRDGRTVEHLLEQTSTVVGRADDSGVAIRDASISRRHARIVVENGNVFVQDLGGASGTFVNGERLTTNERMAISPSDALRFGDVDAFYVSGTPAGEPARETIPPVVVPPVVQPAVRAALIPPVVAPPMQAAAASPPSIVNAPFPLASAQVPSPQPSAVPSRVTVTISMPNTRVDPGQPVSGTVSVMNRGTIVEQATLSVAGLPADWATLLPATFALLPGTKADATLTIRPPRQPDATAGERSFTVVAALRVASSEVSASGSIEILAFEGTTVELTPRQSDGDFKVTIQNAGNRAAHLQFSGEDAEAQLEYDFEPPFVEVPAGQSRTTSVRVKPPKRPMTGIRAMHQFTLHVVPEAGARRDLAGVLMVDPRFGKGLPVKKLAALFLIALALLLAFLFFPRGDKGDVPSSTTTAEASASAAAAASIPDFLCGPEALATPAAPVAGDIRAAPVVLASVRGLLGADPSSPLFAQNDTRWAKAEYAKATDDAFREQNACGKTIEQCGCAMTSVATVLALFQLVTMPDGTALTPQTVNSWFNAGATRTASGWVSQGYIYGNVIWAAANQLSGAIKQAHPEARSVRFRSVGSGSEDQIRSELRAGRPVVLEVPGHWIAAIGIDSQNRILINDPYYADRTTLDVYAGKVKSSVLFEPSDNLSAIVVSVPATARVKVSDSQGRVTGTLDSGPADQTQGKALTDIGGSTYSYTAAWRDPTCTEKPPPAGAGTIQVVLPAGGGYTIEIVNPTKGGTSVAIHAYDEKGNVVVSTKDAPGNQTIKITPTAVTPVVPSTTVPTTASTTVSATTVSATATISPTVKPTPTPAPTATVMPTPTPTTAPTLRPTVDPRPAAKLDCGEPLVVVRAFPAERNISCRLVVTGKYSSIKWYYNHGRCDPPAGGGVCIGRSGPPAELQQWQDGLVINGFGAFTEEAVTFTFIANVCDGTACRAVYFWVEFKQG